MIPIDEQQQAPEYIAGYEAGYSQGAYETRRQLKITDVIMLAIVALMAIKYFRLI